MQFIAIVLSLLFVLIIGAAWLKSILLHQLHPRFSNIVANIQSITPEYKPPDYSPIEIGLLIDMNLNAIDYVGELIYALQRNEIKIIRASDGMYLEAQSPNLLNFESQMRLYTILGSRKEVLSKLAFSNQSIVDYFNSRKSILIERTKEDLVKKGLLMRPQQPTNFVSLVLELLFWRKDIGRYVAITDKGLAVIKHALGHMNYLELAEEDRLRFHHPTPSYSGEDIDLSSASLGYAVVFGLVDDWYEYVFSNISVEDKTNLDKDGSLHEIAAEFKQLDREQETRVRELTVLKKAIQSREDGDS